MAEGEQSLVLAEEFEEYIREAARFSGRLDAQIRDECSNGVVALVALIGVARHIAKEQNMPLEVLARMAEKGVREIIAGSMTIPAPKGKPV